MQKYEFNNIKNKFVEIAMILSSFSAENSGNILITKVFQMLRNIPHHNFVYFIFYSFKQGNVKCPLSVNPRLTDTITFISLTNNQINFTLIAYWCKTLFRRTFLTHERL